MKVLKKIALIFCVVVVAMLLVAGCQILRHSTGPALTTAANGALRVATYNVHYVILNRKTGAWGTDHWEKRKVPMDTAFKTLNADIVATQEMETFAGGNNDSTNLTREWLLENNPGYNVAATGPWQSFPSTQPIFYRHEKLALVDQGWFFFSETPDQIYSRTFNGSYPAFASWAKFEVTASSHTFSVVNVHTDFSSRENRSKSVALIAKRIKPWIENNERVFVVGDLNARHGSSLHKQLESVGVEFVKIKGSTYHFNRGLHLFGAIDHIGYTNNVTPVTEATVVRNKFGKTWPTDHYPVVADFYLE